ncbi:FxsA family membrane protein [Campylobacter blaseri]|uniref:FxsA protein n=1 Tax=Campylobacter blaseri TaxID=2042961 RepID=A0A2P8QZK5_9BACT|nr:FxsA family protein [Campylobacter blaseri]PSM51668.1 hypothetical protein CQ405_05925 [Campylobacter blaseri]PSM53458.1 hypothetical protein CRN67_05925 [Campylobacter blaseri]QKF86263.1 FxsA family membrane protein [Campylobacter blaseri]
MKRTFRFKNLTPIYFVLETMISFYFIFKHGGFLFLLEVVITALIGVKIISKFGFLNFATHIQRLTPLSMLKNFGIAIGGLLMLFPGILTDLMGILLLISAFITSFKEKRKEKKNYRNTQNNTYNYTEKEDTKKKEAYDIIDVEIIDEGK